MPLYTDQLGRTIQIKHQPQTIVSLVPSQTEFLYHLGLAKEVAAITKFCVHPKEWFQTKTRIGGTKQLHLDKIKQLKPDLIIANKEENVKEQVEELAKEFPVWISDVHDIATAVDMMLQIGSITGRKEKAIEISNKIQTGFSELSTINFPPLRTAYLIWREPYMTIGKDTFIHQMLNHIGLDNVFKAQTRYPQITTAQLQAAKPDLLLLSSEPYPFGQKHIDELQPYLPDTKIVLADGEMFSWYGSRLLQAPAYFKALRSHLLNTPSTLK